MLHFGLRAAQNVGPALGVPDILVLGMRGEVVVNQSAAHAGRRCFLEALILKAVSASVHLTCRYWVLPSVRMPVSSTFLTSAFRAVRSPTAALAGFHLLASRRIISRIDACEIGMSCTSLMGLLQNSSRINGAEI